MNRPQTNILQNFVEIGRISIGYLFGLETIVRQEARSNRTSSTYHILLDPVYR